MLVKYQGTGQQYRGQIYEYMCAFLRPEQRDFVCVCVGGGGVIVQGAPEGSTGRLIFVVAFGEACA